MTQEEEALLEAAVEEAHREIPENSASLLIDQSTSRFSSAIWYDKIREQNIILAGCGGIGSWCGMLLGRLKPHNLFLFDDDNVDVSNMSGQLYGYSHINISKVQCLYNIIREYSGYISSSFNRKFTESDTGCNIMICGFDNMDARKTFFRVWKNHIRNHDNPENCLYIDGRLAAEEFQILCLRGDDTYNIEKYENEFLFSDSEADVTLCSYKQTSFVANMIGSIMVNLFVNHCANMCEPLIPRDLPFFTSYSADTMFFKTIS